MTVIRTSCSSAAPSGQAMNRLARSLLRTSSSLALYRNDGAGAFEDVTSPMNLEVSLYGMGVAVGDYG